jgi:hypothetical protein
MSDTRLEFFIQIADHWTIPRTWFSVEKDSSNFGQCMSCTCTAHSAFCRKQISIDFVISRKQIHRFSGRIMKICFLRRKNSVFAKKHIKKKFKCKN